MFSHPTSVPPILPSRSAFALAPDTKPDINQGLNVGGGWGKIIFLEPLFQAGWGCQRFIVTDVRLPVSLR